MLERYYTARDALKLELVDDSGQSIRTSAIHIADYTIEEGPTAIEFDVLVTDAEYWTARLRTVASSPPGTNH